MKVSQEAKNVYERTNKIWKDNGFTIRFGEPNEPADFKTAVQCIKAFWLKEFNQEFPYKIENATYDYAIGLTRRKRKSSWIVEDLSTHGRRDNKSKVKGYYTYKLAPHTGWANIIHETGHLAGLKLGHRHNAEHACIELRFTKFFFSKKYIEKSRKRLEANPPSYTNHVMDCSGQIKKQKKKRISYKQMCITCAKLNDWLYFEMYEVFFNTLMWEFEDKRITKACSKYSNLYDSCSYEDIAANYWCEYKWKLENLTWKERWELLSKHKLMTNEDIDDYAKNIMKGV
jgi:hypothetical protein